MARQRKTATGEPAATAELQGDDDDRLPTAAPPPGMRTPLQSATAQALRPAGGMLRISKGDQQRCIWPVHLSGWQQLGWQLVNQSEQPGRKQQGYAQQDPVPAPVSTTAESVSWTLAEDLNPAAAPEPIEAREAMENGHPMPTTDGDTTDA
jgi:hypothetical protein